MKFSFYGGAMEVGRSCISVDDRYLFDAGLKLSEEGSEYPLPFDYSAISDVFISHAHLDHTGALPLLNHNGLRASIFCNAITKNLTKLLLKDSLHIELLEQHAPGYDKENIYNVMDLMQIVKYNKEYSVGKNATVKFIYAGHIPGSASVLLDYNSYRILYTGDINTIHTHLLDGASVQPGDVDVMITESTYGDRNHPLRKNEEQKFLNKIEETVRRGGSVLVPAFAVGRAQEVLCMIATRKFGVSVYLDGMAKKVSNMFLRKPDVIRNNSVLAKALNSVRFVKGWRERKEIVKEQGIFVTTSGMLDGGPVIDYLSSLYFNQKSSVLLTGYQAEGTNGRLLLEDGKVYIDGIRMKVRGDVVKYDFSAHAGQKELAGLINQISPKNLMIQHGDPGSVTALGKLFSKKCKVYMPKLGETIDIKR